MRRPPIRRCPSAALPGARLAPADRPAASEFHQDGFQGFARAAGYDLRLLAGQGDMKQGKGVDVHEADHRQLDSAVAWDTERLVTSIGSIIS